MSRTVEQIAAEYVQQAELNGLHHISLRSADLWAELEEVAGSREAAAKAREEAQTIWKLLVPSDR